MGLRKNLIRTFYELKGRSVIREYENLTSSSSWSLERVKDQQLMEFKKLFDIAKSDIPYYDNLFRRLKLSKADFKNLNDLSKIPILTKSIIKANLNDFVSRRSIKNFVHGSTGGSTGEPLKYKMSEKDYSLGVALLLRGMGYGGYEIGDKLAVVAGGSLIKDQISIKSKAQNYLLNFRKYSSYGMSDHDLLRVTNEIAHWSAKYLRGYASSLALLAKFCKGIKHNLSLNSVYSTAEVLSDYQRLLIEDVFGCRVFDNYGLSDGGVSAFEEREGRNLIIDTERAILEVVSSDKNCSTDNESGSIIATSLFNYAFPFIRYDTGDMGSQKLVRTDREVFRKCLNSIEGRVTDYIILNGQTIGSPVLTVLMGKIDALKYQFIQNDENSLELRIDPEETYNQEQSNYIINSIRSNIEGEFRFEINYTTKFIESNNKHRFIIRKF